MTPGQVAGALVVLLVQRLAEFAPQRFFLLRGSAMTRRQGQQGSRHQQHRYGASLTKESKPHWLKVLQQSKI
jgi:hypothetical protein